MDLLRQATIILLLGMSLVFVFLAVVILCVQVTARLVRRYEDTRETKGGGPMDSGPGDAVVAAIAVAIHESEGRSH